MIKLKPFVKILASSIIAGSFFFNLASCTPTAGGGNNGNEGNDDGEVVIDVSDKDQPVLYKNPQNYKELYANLYMPVDKIGSLTVYDEAGNKTVIPDDQLMERENSSTPQANKISRSSRNALPKNSVGWHPLKKPVTEQVPKTEVLRVADDITCYEDENERSNSKNVGSGSYDNYKILGVGDFDGDSRDEVFILYYIGDGNKFTYRIFDKTNGVDPVLTDETAMDSSYVYWEDLEYWIMSGRQYQDVIMAGDVNGDGKDELLLTDGKQVFVYSVDISSNSVTHLQTITPVDSDAPSVDSPYNPYKSYYHVQQLIVGDFDNDGIDDLITVKTDFKVYNIYKGTVNYTGEIEFFKGSNGSSPLLDGVLLPRDLYTASKNPIKYCKGDYDGDETPEFYYIYTNTDNEKYKVIVYSIKEKTVMLDAECGSSSTTYYDGSVPVCADFDFDGKDELFLDRFLLKTDASSVTLLGTITNYNSAKFCLRPFAGDYNGDGKYDIYWANQFYNETRGDNYIAVYSYDGSSLVELASSHELKNAGIKPDKTGNEKFVVGNFDTDTKKLRYTGHEITISDPKILAVLCAAPYSQAIVDSGKYDGYGPGDWSTSFSSGKSSSEGVSKSFGLSVGVGVGFELHLGAVTGDTEVMVTHNFNKSFSKSTTVSKEITCSGTAAYDHVIFTSIPIDHFYYEIIDETPGSEENGKCIDITVPRSNTISNMSVDSYNKRNGNFPDVMPRAHTVGQPNTYLSKNDARAKAYLPYGASENYRFIIEDGSHVTFDDSNELAGGNANELCISVEQESEVSNGKGVEISAGTELSGGIFTKATAKVEAGVSYDVEWSQSTGKGTSFSGTIGSLPESWINEHPEDDFTAGMYVYNQDVYVADSTVNLGDLQEGDVFSARKDSYWVVTYWVE